MTVEAIENRNRKKTENDNTVDLEALLLKGPTATQKQLDIITQNRKAINQQ